MPRTMQKKLKFPSIRDINNKEFQKIMAKYDGLLGQPVLEVEEPDAEGGVTLIFKDNRFLFVKVVDGKLDTISIPE